MATSVACLLLRNCKQNLQKCTTKTTKSVGTGFKMERSQIPKYVMNTLCRICAEKSSTLTPIFQNEELPLKIYKCLPIQVNESDFLPLNICKSCFSKINESYTIYIKAEEADKRLKSLWKILLKETMNDFSETPQFTEDPVTEINETQEELHKMSPSNLVINIPEKGTCHSEILGGSHLVNGAVNEVMVISKAVSFELITESMVLKSSEKSSELQIQDSQEREILSKPKEETLFDGKAVQAAKENHESSSAISLCAHESTHLEERPHLCDTCGKLFKNAKYLKSHTQTHLSIRKKHICKVCSKGFLSNFFLQEHMNSHTGETPYKCQVCDKEFRERVHLRQHKWTHSTQKFVCPVCGSKFNRKGNMTEHVKQYHKNGSSVKLRKKTEENANEMSNFKCPACICEFPSQLLLKSHLKIHPEQKRFCCSMCGKKFRHSGSLTYHRRSAHTGERPFQCGFCDKRFSLRSVQIIHERKTHTFEHPYKCTFCSRPFTNSSSLRNHMYVHAKDKMFKCDECGRKFSRSSNLVVHKKLHSGDRQFACEQCGKSYIQRHDLLKHQKTHDPKSKPFFCKYCGNSFSHKKDSAKHTMCQFDFLRKKNSEVFSAENILESVTKSLEKSGRDFNAEEEQQLILESVKEFSGRKIAKDDLIYRVSGGLNSAEV